MLIVLEGLDGAGKSTQVKLLKEYIISKGLDLKYIHFPRFDTPVYGDLIAKFLRGDFGAIENVHPQLVALLFAEDRRVVGQQIRQWLSEGSCVLLDRYVYSNIAYQCSKLVSVEQKKELKQWILDTEYLVNKLPLPDTNIFLDVPINFVDKMLKENREGDDREYLQGKQDIHEADINFQISVRDMYLQQVEEDINFVRVDCSSIQGYMLPASDIFNKIEAQIQDKL